jgi:hypothetical protein
MWRIAFASETTTEKYKTSRVTESLKNHSTAPVVGEEQLEVKGLIVEKY